MRKIIPSILVVLFCGIATEFSPAIASPSRPWIIQPAPKELPPIQVKYMYIRDGKTPPGCTWSKDRFGHLYPKEAIDTTGNVKLTTAIAERCLPTVNYSWEDFLQFSLENLTIVPTRSGYKALATSPAHLSSIMTAYGLLQAGNNPVFDRPWEFTEKFRIGAMRRILQSPTLREKIYVWAMPSVQKAFFTLDTDDRDEYRRVLFHARKYILSANQEYGKEIEYLRDLEQGRCKDATWLRSHGLNALPKWIVSQRLPCTYLFTDRDPAGRESPYRKVETFIFRRMRNDAMTADSLLVFVDRAIQDLRGPDRTAR